MNILILNWRDPKNPLAGGAEIVTMEHAKGWVRANHSVVWFSTFYKGAKKEEVVEGVHFVRRGSDMSIFFFAPLFYLFSGHTFDVVVDEIHGIPFFTPLFVRKRKIAFIHEVAGEIWDYMKPFPLNVFGKMIESFYFLLYRSITFWTDAQSTAQELTRHGIPKQNCVVIPCPIKNTLISSLPKKEKVPTYVFVNRLVKMKGIEDVIEAFEIIVKQQKDAILWIVGRGEESYVKKLNALVVEKKLKNSIVFWGHVDEKQKLERMRRAHILLHASVKEGWGLVVLEAASQGTPSVVYNVSGLRDTVKNNITGIIVEYNNPRSLAKSAIVAYSDKARYMRFQENGLKWVGSLSWENVISQSLRLLTK